MTRYDIKALILALVAMIGLDALLSAMLMAHFAGDVDVLAMPDAERKALALRIHAMPGFLGASLLLGNLTTLLGGFLVARIARSFPYYNALAFGVVGVAFVLWNWGVYPLWYQLLFLFLTVPLSLYGARICVHRMRERAAQD